MQGNTVLVNQTKKGLTYQEDPDQTEGPKVAEETEEINKITSLPYDPTTLPENFSMIIYGRRRSGKTFQLRHMVNSIKKRFTDVYLFSDTADLQDEDYDYIPSENRIKGLDEKKMQEIIQKQREIIEYNKQRKDKVKSKPLIILDDIISDPQVRKSPVLNSLYTLGRHIECSVITLTQEIGGKYGVPRVLRSNCDCIVGFFAHSEIDRKMICQQYASVTEGGSREGSLYFKKIASSPYTSAVFDLQNIQARKYEDYIYYYKVPNTKPKFLIGKKSGLKSIKETKKSILPVHNFAANTESYMFHLGGRQIPEVRIRIAPDYENPGITHIVF